MKPPTIPKPCKCGAVCTLHGEVRIIHNGPLVWVECGRCGAHTEARMVERGDARAAGRKAVEDWNNKK